MPVLIWQNKRTSRLKNIHIIQKLNLQRKDIIQQIMRKIKKIKKNEENKKNKKTNLQNFIYGVKLGIKLSLLPKSVESFHSHPLTRIFRVIGGISILLILLKVKTIDKPYLYEIVFILAALQFTYIIIIGIIKFCYYIYLYKNNKLEVRNSPLNRIATFGLNLVACVKGTCQYGITAGAALGLGVSIDELLVHHGRDSVFKDVLGHGLDQTL